VYYVYPAIFTPNPQGGYIVTVPDVPGCITGGKKLDDSMKMIKDALCGCLCVLEDEGIQPAASSDPAQFTSQSQAQEGSFVALIEADTIKYRSEYDNRAVRRNVSLPAWLNAKAEQSHINVSQVLQEALRKRLKI